MTNNSSFMDDLSRQSLLSLLQKIVRIFDRDAPMIEHVGKNKMILLAAKADMNLPEKDMDYFLNNASEKISDKFVELVGREGKENIVLRGAAVGLTAGVGAVLLHDDNGGLNFKSKERNKKKLMTLGYYVAGGVLASLITWQLNKPNHSELMDPYQSTNNFGG